MNEEAINLKEIGEGYVNAFKEGKWKEKCSDYVIISKDKNVKTLIFYKFTKYVYSDLLEWPPCCSPSLLSFKLKWMHISRTVMLRANHTSAMDAKSVLAFFLHTEQNPLWVFISSSCGFIITFSTATYIHGYGHSVPWSHG